MRLQDLKIQGGSIRLENSGLLLDVAKEAAEAFQNAQHYFEKKRQWRENNQGEDLESESRTNHHSLQGEAIVNLDVTTLILSTIQTKKKRRKFLSKLKGDEVPLNISQLLDTPDDFECDKYASFIRDLYQRTYYCLKRLQANGTEMRNAPRAQIKDTAERFAEVFQVPAPGT